MLKSPDAIIAFRLFCYQFFIVAANVAARTSRDTYLMQGDFKKHLPLLIAVTAVIMYLVVRAQSFVAGGKSPVFVAIAAPLVAMLSYLAFTPFQMTGFASVIYFIWTEVVNSLLTVQFWILAASVLDMRSGKKLFGVIGAGGAIGGLMAGLILAPLGRLIGVGLFPACAGLMLLLAVPFVFGLKGRATIEAPRPQDDTSANAQWNLFHPYIVKLGFLLIPATVVATLVDYQFKVVSAAAIPNSTELAAYYGRYYAILNGLTLVFQIFVTSFFLTRLGLLASLVFLPLLLTIFAIPTGLLSLSMGTGALTLMLAFSFASRLTDQTVKFTIYQSAFQLLWLPVPPLHKPQLKMSLEAVLKNGVAGLAGLAIAGAAFVFPPSGETFHQLQTVVALATLVFLIWWLISAWAMRQSYRQHLVQSLESRLVDFSADDLEINSPEIRNTIRGALLSREEGAVAFALDILSHQSLEGWQSDLETIFHSSAELIQTRILELAEGEPSLLPETLIRSLATGQSVHKISARIIAARRNYLIARQQNTTATSTYELAIGICCDALSDVDKAKSLVEIEEMLHNGDVDARTAMLRAVIHFPELADVWTIGENLQHSSAEIRNLALEVTRAGQLQLLVQQVILNLADPKTYQAAKNTLTALDPLVVQNELLSQEYFLLNNPEMVHGVFRYLAGLNSPDATRLILQNLQVSDPQLFFTGCKSIDSLARTVGLTREARKEIDAKIVEAAGMYLTALKLLLSENTFSNQRTLVGEWLESAMAHWLMGACKLVAAGRGLTLIESRFDGRRVRHEKSSEFLELMENSATMQTKSLILAMLESKSDAEIVTRLQANLTTLVDPVKYWLISGVEWPATMASLICKTPEENRNMYPTLEKILLLKSVEMFSKISGEDIARIIQISREIEKPADSVLFRAGEEGHELFILLAGEVKIERDGRLLAHLKRGDFLGEMALLDSEPRSADATTLSDCKLLCIAQQDFFDVLSGRPEILRAILRLLSGRLRRAIQVQAAPAS